jgi:hypothetical protein
VLENAARLADDIAKIERCKLQMWFDTLARGGLQSTEELVVAPGMGGPERVNDNETAGLRD